ncbi:pentatricopeptide repeat domain containing protein [Babesia bovis T2Bo]|uniref:Pentatricopeptide repeat domain containing protein n=1 Tax=Babesia bovis TaxID=5865 RepID=A7AVM1_BABBO|nr:pentatricopeptide repeat domain containing protein [Babesia bovis T2Bo]EDO05847.1 pentatricopeptide repeat domain containing protein [Babesia bovis T2Bo]|eukprot:XP_001609415.1 pentatricopeptide repeat domain containing protein [Babesia bovis T2Bo]
MVEKTFDSQACIATRNRKVTGECRQRYSGTTGKHGCSNKVGEADEQVFTRLKTIFRGPVKCPSRDQSVDSSFTAPSFDPLSKGLYNGESSMQCSTEIGSFDMSTCGGVGALDPIGTLGYGEKVMCLDTLAQALADESESYAHKSGSIFNGETPLTHLASVDTSATQDMLTPLGAGSLEIGCDFADRVGKLLSRCVAGEEVAWEELASLCANEFNIQDTSLSPATLTALLRFCMLKGQLYLAGQLLQVAWYRGVRLSVDEQSHVILSLCSADAIGLARSLIAKLPLNILESEEIMQMFVNGIVNAAKENNYKNVLNFISVLDDTGSSLDHKRAARLIELFVSAIDGDDSPSPELVDAIQRLSSVEAFSRVSLLCRYGVCALLCCAQNNNKVEDSIKVILHSCVSTVGFLEHASKMSSKGFVAVVNRLVSLHLMNGVDLLSALCLGNRVSSCDSAMLEIYEHAQGLLYRMLPPSLHVAGFTGAPLLSVNSIRSFVKLMGTRLPTSMLCICAWVSGVGKEMFSPLVEACLMVEDFTSADAVLKYMVEYYGHIPAPLMVKFLCCHTLNGNFRFVLDRLAKKDKMASCLRERQNRSHVISVAEFGMRVAISLFEFNVASEFHKYCDTAVRISQELSQIMQELPPLLNSRGKVDEFVTFCERINLDDASFSVALDCCLRLKNPKRLLRLITKFRQMGLQPQLQTCGVIIKSLGCCGRIAECKEIWKEMANSQGNEPNEVTYGIMLDAYVNNNRMEEAMDLLQEMKQKGNVKPNTIMYTTLIKGFGQNRQLQRAMSIYDMMVSEGVMRNTVTYNSIIDACARVGDMKAAAALLEEMMMNQVEPDLITFSTIIKGYCVQCNMDQSFQLLSIMYERGIKPDGILYNSLLEGCVKSGRLWLCEKLWEQMRIHGIAPSNFTLTILIKMYGRSGQLDKVFDLVERLPAEYGFTINAHVYTCLMSACITNGRYNTALDIYRCVKDGSVKPDAKTYETLLQGVTRGNLFAEAVDLLRDMYNLDGNHTDQADAVTIQKINPRVLENLFNKVQNARLDPEVMETYRSLGQRLQLLGVNVHVPF